MKSTINSIKLLISILWNISNRNQKIKTFFIVILSILTSLLQYINIIFTALTFSFITSLAYSDKNSLELDFIFGNKIQLQSDDFLQVIFAWIVLSIFTYLSAIFSSLLIYKLAYSYGKILSNKILSISINSNSLFFESISEKTLFNLITSENTLLIKGSIFSLVTLPMQLTIIISLLSVIFSYSSYLIFVLPFFGIVYLMLSNFVFKSTTKKGEEIFKLRSLQTDLLSRIIDNYIDVKFPPSDKAYKKLFNRATSSLRDHESIIATIPKILKSILELSLILIIGIYIFYSISILNLPIEYFISYSAAIILSLLKLSPLISGLSSNFLSFNSQYESIKNYYDLIFKSEVYSLFSKKINYAQVNYGKKYELNFENLKSKRIFKYKSSKSLSLKFNKSRLLWIIGKSGSGKSTFLSMVGGIRPINQGRITLVLNQLNIKNKTENIKDFVAYMPQNPIFHSITVLDFIKDGDPELDLSKLNQILNRLKIADSFSMSANNLLKLVIGPQGYSPSGGQAKLLAFARLMYKKNVYLYLLDEPTSDLSEGLKEIVLNEIFDLAKSKFVLCITHDLSSIRENDVRLKF